MVAVADRSLVAPDRATSSSGRPPPSVIPSSSSCSGFVTVAEVERCDEPAVELETHERPESEAESVSGAPSMFFPEVDTVA